MKFEDKVKYGKHTAKVIGIIPAFFEVGNFPEGIDDIDTRYLDLNFDKTKLEHDTVLIEVDGSLIRVLPHALKLIAEEKVTKKNESKKEKK